MHADDLRATLADRSAATSPTPRAHPTGACATAGFDTPIVVTGGIHAFDQAEAILAAGAADIVGAARQTLADPDWFRKIRLGLGDEVRRCSFTNYCEALDQRHRQVTCKLWDRADLAIRLRDARPTAPDAWSRRARPGRDEPS